MKTKYLQLLIFAFFLFLLSSCEKNPSEDVKTYKVGDYYNEKGKEGVVFWVDETGQYGKIVSLKESSTPLQWAADYDEQNRMLYTSEDDGAQNMKIVMNIAGWELKYPAFSWCGNLGKDWYLPAIDELQIFTCMSSVRDKINTTLASYGGTKIPDEGTVHYYFSSTDVKGLFENEYDALTVRMETASASFSYKRTAHYVRAIANFHW